MAKIPARNLFLVLQKRFLQMSATMAPSTPLPTNSLSLLGLEKLQLTEKEGQNAQSIAELFKSHGFNNTHIAKLMEKRPQLFQCRVEKNLKPKMEFLNENGFVGEFLADLIVSNPNILIRALDSHIKPTLEVFKSILGCNEKVFIVFKRCHWLLSYDLKGVMKPNFDYLIKEGVPVDRVAKLIMLQPRTIMQKHDRIVYVVNAVKNMGVKPNCIMFIHCVRVMSQMNESTWNKKMELFKSLGWSDEQILFAFRKYPHCLACSEEKIRKMMDFFMNTMKLGPEYIIASPKLLYLSINKRIHPRYKVFKFLETKKLAKGMNVLTLLKMTEKEFLQNYVTKHADEVPGLLEMYDDAKKAKR